MTARCIPVSPLAIERAAKVIREGGIVAFPTDTVYGLGCDPSNQAAVRALFQAKSREAKPIPLLCAALSDAKRLVVLNETAMRLAELHWPGALTIVAPMRKGSGLSRLLHRGDGYLGVRVPDSETSTELAREVGGAVTGTSANISGRAPCRTAAQAMESLGERIQLVIDGGTLRGKASTVVKVSGATVEVLREGSVSLQEGDLLKT
jgi:L-threonylcarbamoyladenylate synthase